MPISTTLVMLALAPSMAWQHRELKLLVIAASKQAEQVQLQSLLLTFLLKKVFFFL
jgi:hypothetical protein